MNNEGRSVAVGIDAAVVANQHVIVRSLHPGKPGRRGHGRGRAHLHDLAAIVRHPQRCRRQSGPGGNGHSAWLRSAVAGKNKSDPIDAEVFSRAGEFFGLIPARVPSPVELALRRTVSRRGKALTEANRSLRRIISLARCAYPDGAGCSGPLAPPPSPLPGPGGIGVGGGGGRPPRRDQCRGARRGHPPGGW